MHVPVLDCQTNHIVYCRMPPLVRIVILGILAAVACYIYLRVQGAKRSSAFVREMSHLRQLGAAIDKCTRDHDGVYPEKLNAPVLQPYLTSELLAFTQKSGVVYQRPQRNSVDNFPALTLNTSEGVWLWRKDGKTEPRQKPANKRAEGKGGWQLPVHIAYVSSALPQLER